MRTTSIALLALSSLAAVNTAFMGTAFADCPLEGTPAEAREAYAKGQQLERSGNLSGAFAAYVTAMQPICDPNPVEADAARRAAALSLTLGAAAEKSGDLQKAFHIYENGGQYAAADRTVMAVARANADDPQAFAQARGVLDQHAQEWFQSNNRIRIAAAGPYRPDPKQLAELLAMPARGVERALQKEAAAFNEDHLREYVRVIQSFPDDPMDVAGQQKASDAHAAMFKKWPEEPMKTARAALDLMLSWASIANDARLLEQARTQHRQRVQQRVATITRSYNGAPELLKIAIEYEQTIRADEADKKARVAAIKSQADKLGDAAKSQQRFLLASAYYNLADQRAKAQQVQEAQRQLVMTKMQPSMQQAEQLQRELSDPAKIKAMQDQAAALRESMRQQQQQPKPSTTERAKKADDLEKELGL